MWKYKLWSDIVQFLGKTFEELLKVCVCVCLFTHQDCRCEGPSAETFPTDSILCSDASWDSSGSSFRRGLAYSETPTSLQLGCPLPAPSLGNVSTWHRSARFPARPGHHLPTQGPSWWDLWRFYFWLKWDQTTLFQMSGVKKVKPKYPWVVKSVHP